MPATAQPTRASADMSVADVMTPPVDTISGGSTVLEAAQLMCERNLRHLVVVDPTQRPVGIVSLRDLLQYWVQRHQVQDGDESPWSLEVTKMITRDPVTVAPDARLSDVATLLARRVVGCIPVIDQSKRLVGVVHMAQVVRHGMLGGGSGTDKSFQLFKPGQAPRRNLPAYFRRSNGSLVLPVNSLGAFKPEWIYVKLGYDAASGRILVRFASEHTPGDMKFKRANLHGDGEYLVVDANDFINHFNIDFKGRAYNIFGKDGNFVLMPRT